MKSATDLFHFFVFSSLFIAIGAGFMGWQTQVLFNLPFNINLLWFIFCGTMCSYNFHWFLSLPDSEKASPKSNFTLNNRSLHLVLSLGGFIGAVIFGLTLWEKVIYLMTTAFFTFLYSAPKIPHRALGFLKNIAVGKTIFLAAAWTHVTAVLPLLVESTEINGMAVLYIINRFFFIYSICILFDFRDREEDKKQNIRSLITFLSEKGIDRLYYFSLMIFALTLLFLYPKLTLTHMLILAIPAIPLSLLYRYFKTNKSDFNYYFILDGLMILSAPLLVFAKFAR